MRFQAVLPSIWVPYTDACWESMDPEFQEFTLVVDNAHGHNRGVAASWNLGVDEMYRRDADWLIIVSAGMRFGPNGGMDFIGHLEDRPEAKVVEAKVVGWHLIAFRRAQIERCGRFDENFYPAYREDHDYAWRMMIAAEEDGDEGVPWPRVDHDGELAAAEHGLKFGGVIISDEQVAYTCDYFVRKWGALSPNSTHRHPFNDPDKPISWWPPPLLSPH